MPFGIFGPFWLRLAVELERTCSRMQAAAATQLGVSVWLTEELANVC